MEVLVENWGYSTYSMFERLLAVAGRLGNRKSESTTE